MCGIIARSAGIAGFSLLLAGAPCAADKYQPVTVHDVDLLDNGNILVTDGGPTRGSGGGIYEIDRDGNVIWSYTDGVAWAHNADRQDDGSVIISDTGNDRVIIVDAGGSILWDSDDVALSDLSALDYPNDANLLSSGNRLITDRDNHRVIEVEADGAIVWQFGETGVPGDDATHLRGPHNADRLADGNTIIADSHNNRVIEVAPDGSIVWTYAGGLNWPRDADRLAGGNTLVNDSSNYRVIEVTSDGSVVWEYAFSLISYDSDRLDSGNTLIGISSTIREVDPSGTTVWSYPPYYETEVVEGYLVTADNGSRLWTKIIQPRADLYPDQSFPAVVSVTGGLSAGEDGDLRLAAGGFIEFHYNAQGRGEDHQSDGEENYNGFINQEDLKAVIEFAHTRSNVIDDNLGVITSSYGITTGAGCLGRFPELEVKYLIDREGPSDSYVTCCEPWSLDDDPSNDRHEEVYGKLGHYSISRDSSQKNLDWWEEREATRYIGNMRCRYLRVQAEWDHAQPPTGAWPGFDYPPLWYQCKHAIDLVNLATEGESPWTRVNGSEIGNPPDTTFSREIPPAYYSGALTSHPGYLEPIVREMAEMDPLSQDPTPTTTATPTSKSAPTITETPTITGTPTRTPTVTLTPTITLTPTVTQTPTITGTPTITNTPTITPTQTVTPTGRPRLAIMKLEGGSDANIYYYNGPGAGDWTYWDALARNPSPHARDLWMIPSGNDPICLAAATGAGFEGLYVLNREEAGDVNLYLYGGLLDGDWTYWDTAARNPSPAARDFWMIPVANDIIGMAAADITDDGDEELVILKKEGDNDLNLYYYNALVAGDWTYWDALARNPSPLARDLWMIAAGNDAVALTATGADGAAGSLVVFRNEGGYDFNLYAYRNLVGGDWTYWDALSRNPSPLARDLWAIPSGNDATAAAALDIDGDGEEELLVLKSEGAEDVNLYCYNSLLAGDWTYWNAFARNPSPMARDLWVIPAGNDAIGMAALSID